MNFPIIQKLQIALSGISKALFLVGIDGFDRTAKQLTGAGTDFNEDENVAMTADQVDLAACRAIIAVEDGVTLATQESGGNTFTIIPDLLDRRQLWRG